MAASLSGCKEARKTPEILRLCNRVVNAQTRLPRPAAELLAKVKRHNQALAKPRINSDAFSLHMRYESAMRFLRKTRIRFRVIEMRTPRALQCWPRICDRIQQQESTGS